MPYILIAIWYSIVVPLMMNCIIRIPSTLLYSHYYHKSYPVIYIIYNKHKVYTIFSKQYNIIKALQHIKT